MLGLAVLSVGGLLYRGFRVGTVIDTQPSPDGRFRLERAVLWEFPPRLFAMPGDGGFTYQHGYVRLRDARGHALAEVYTDAIGLVERVEWTADRVSFVYPREDLHSVEWPLPAP